MNENAFDVRGRGWTRHQDRVTRGLEAWITVSVMQVADNACRVEQDDEVLGEIGERIHFQFVFAEPDRAGLSDAERGAHDSDIDIGQ